MIYQKIKLTEELVITAPFDKEELYCICPECGREVHLDDDQVEILENDNDVDFSCSFFCPECEQKRKDSLKKSLPILSETVVKIEELDLGKLEDLHKLVSLYDSGYWKILSFYYKNGSKKPPFVSLGRIK